MLRLLGPKTIVYRAFGQFLSRRLSIPEVSPAIRIDGGAEISVEPRGGPELRPRIAGASIRALRGSRYRTVKDLEPQKT